MKRNPKYYQIVFLFLLVLTVFSCSKSRPVKNIIISKDDLPTISIDNVVRNYTEQGTMRGMLQAPKMNYFEGIVEPYYDFPNGIIILMYKGDKIETSLRANRGLFYANKKTGEAIGSVVITNINGDVLQTQKLYFDYNQKKIFTDQFVKITKADGTVTRAGKGFESNTDFTIYQFVDVSGRLVFNEEFSSVNDSVPPSQ